MFKRIASLCIMATVSEPALAQDFIYPRAGQCPALHLKFQGVCISSKILDERDTETVVRQMMEFKSKNRPLPGSRGVLSACMTTIDEDNDDILKLDNWAIVEITRGYLGYVGYRKDALLFKDGLRWKIWIEGKRVFPVDLYREPQSCSEPSLNSIEAAVNDEVFIINGEKLEAKVGLAKSGEITNIIDCHKII